MQPKLLTTLRTYSWKLFRADLLAGVTVAMVALPLSLAIAIASGADPAKGLITAIIGGFLISMFGGSRVQIGGPTGAFIVIVFGVISTFGYDGLVLATLMAGIILLVAGFFRFGSLIHFVPISVITGFTLGIAIVIAGSQLRDFFGLEVEDISADLLETLPKLWNARETWSPAALLVALSTGVLIVLLRRAFPRFPGLLLAIGAASFMVSVARLPVETIGTRFGVLPNHLPMPEIPEISLDRMIELLPSALVIAFLAGVESLLSATVADRMIGSKHRPNAEILAQGIANICSSLFGGMPATGAIARTATNVRAGAKTPVAGMVHSLTLLLVIMVAAPLTGYLAMPALAALLILTSWDMSEPAKWRNHLAAPLEDRVLLVMTLVLTVLVDLTVAIGVGVALGLVLRMRRGGVPPADWSPPDR